MGHDWTRIGPPATEPPPRCDCHVRARECHPFTAGDMHPLTSVTLTAARHSAAVTERALPTSTRRPNSIRNAAPPTIRARNREHDANTTANTTPTRRKNP